MKSKIKHLFFWLILIGLVLAVIESTLQGAYYIISHGGFIYERNTRPIYAPDEIRGYRVIPNMHYVHKTNEFQATYDTNSLGLRSTAAHEVLPYEKPAGTTRLMQFGPSFTFGWGVDYEDNYPTILENKLKEQGMSVDTLNLGTPGQQGGYQLAWAEKEGYKYHPDIVIQVIYSLIDDRIVPLDYGEHAPVLPHHVVQNGYYLYYYWGEQDQNSAPTWLDQLRHNTELAAKNTGIVFFGYLAYQTVRDWLRAPEAGERYADTIAQAGSLKLLDSFDNIIASYVKHQAFLKKVLGQNVRVIYLFIPPAYLVHPDDIPRWSHFSAGQFVKPDELRAHINKVAAALKQDGVEFLDPTDALTAAGKTQRMYFWLDAHFTKYGNAVVADELAKRLLPAHARTP